MYLSVWRVLQRAFHERGTRAYAYTEAVVYALIVLSLITLAIDVGGSPSPRVHDAFQRFDRALLLIFVAEYALRIATYAPPELNVFDLGKAWRLRRHIFGRVRFAMRPLMLVDLFTVLALVPALRALRAIRLFRLVRSIRLFRHSDPFLGVIRGFQENSLLYGGIFGLFALTVLVGGTTVYLVEAGANPSVNSLADGLWWTIVTVTTVGYGDISPATGLGRLIGGALMVTGMFTLALFAGIVGNSLLQAILSLRNESFRMSNKTDHLIVCGYHEGVDMLLRNLRQEVGEDGEIVIFHPSARPPNLHPSFYWVNGDPARESEVSKVRIGSARSVIIVASREVPPQQADARTILVCFTIRSFLRGDASSQSRKKPVHIACEILEEENVQHAERAGANDIVDTSRLGFSLLTRAVFSHGSAASITEVAEGHGDRFYIRENPLAEPVTYGELSRQLLAEHNQHTFGVYHLQKEQLDLGPSDDMVVTPDDMVVFLETDDVKRQD